jgi:crossover junction endodeoxyribonuclease RuvC
VAQQRVTVTGCRGFGPTQLQQRVTVTGCRNRCARPAAGVSCRESRVVSFTVVSEQVFGRRCRDGGQRVTMRVLGIDPGLTRCGLGVVDGSVGRPLHLVAVGVVRTAPELPVAERLCAIEQGIDAWLDEHRPDAVAVERVFSQHNVRTVMGTAQASGIAMMVAARRGIPVALHTPRADTPAASASGRADKPQVGAMVTRLLRLDAAPKPADAADALALAICHIWRGSAQSRIDAALAAAGRTTR